MANIPSVSFSVYNLWVLYCFSWSLLNSMICAFASKLLLHPSNLFTSVAYKGTV